MFLHSRGVIRARLRAVNDAIRNAVESEGAAVVKAGERIESQAERAVRIAADLAKAGAKKTEAVAAEAVTAPVTGAVEVLNAAVRRVEALRAELAAAVTEANAAAEAADAAAHHGG